MQVDVADAGTLRKQLTITIAAKEVAAREDQLLGRYAPKANVKGFRRGHVPKAVLKKRYGEAVKHEAQEALLQEALRQALDEHQLRPLGPISGDELDLSGGIKQVASFDIRPQIELPDPRSIRVSDDDIEPTPADVQKEIEQICERGGQHLDLEPGTPLADGDVVRLTGKVTAGDELVRQVHDLSHVLGGYPLFGKAAGEVVELIADKKVGDALEFDTHLPENFKPEAWADKDAHVSVTVATGQRLQPAELDEALAKRFGAETVEQLQQRITDYLRSSREDALRRKQHDELVDGLIAATSFELPPKLLESLINDNLQRLVDQKKEKDADLDVAALREQERPAVTAEVENYLRRSLLLDAIADSANLQATREDLQQQLTMAAYQSRQDPQELFKHLQESGRLNEVMTDIRQAKAVQYFLQQVLETAETEPTDEAATPAKPKTKPKAKAKAPTKAQPKAQPEKKEADAS